MTTPTAWSVAERCRTGTARSLVTACLVTAWSCTRTIRSGRRACSARPSDSCVAGYAVDVVCLRDSGEPARESHHGVEIHRLDVQIDKRSLAFQFLSYLNFGLRAMVTIARLHHRRRYTSVQVHNLPDFLVFCAIVPKLQGVGVILDLHDLMPEFFRAGSRPRPAAAGASSGG